MRYLFSSALAEEITSLADEAAAAPTAEPTFWQEVSQRVADVGSTGWITLITLVVLAVLITVMSITRKQWNARSLAFAAVSVALSFLLSCIKVYEMPQGGSVTAASMLPLMLYSAAFGVGPGLVAGACDGLLQYLQGGWFVHPIQFLLDYPIAFAMIGLAGLHRYLPKATARVNLYPAMAIAAMGRAAAATLAGVLYWDTAPWASLVYNGTYLIPDTFICIVVAVFVGQRLLKEMKRIK